MNIVNASYTSEDSSSLKATLDDGTVWYMPQPCETWHNAALQAFLDGGGAIEPYVAPPEPPPEPVSVDTVEQRLEHHLEVSDARLDALEQQVLSMGVALNEQFAAVLRRLDALGSN